MVVFDIRKVNKYVEVQVLIESASFDLGLLNGKELKELKDNLESAVCEISEYLGED